MAYAGKSGTARSVRPAGNLAPRQPLSVSGRASRPATLVSGVAIGLLIGAGIALLFAPKIGRDTRRDIRRGLRRAAGRGHDAWDDLRDELRRARRQLKRARRARQVNLEEPELAEP